MNSDEFSLRERLADFDPNDPFDVVADRYRLAVVSAFLNESSIKEGDDISPALYGMLTGLVGVVTCFCDEQHHNGIMKAFIDYIPHAMENVRASKGLPPLPKDH